MQDWVDGRPAQQLGVKDRGLAYGDGLFETIAVRAGRPTLFDAHLQRLRIGCERLAIKVDQALLKAEMQAFAAELGEGVMKLIVTRGDSQRGYAADPQASSRRILQGGPAPAYPPAHAEQGVALFSCATRLGEQPLLAGLKHLNRLEQVLARAEWQSSEFAEGLMRDTSGRLIEGVYSNLFLLRDEVLLTPDLSRCGVAGVMRGQLIEGAAGLGLAVVQRDIEFRELAHADEVFVCNSVYGVWPVIACEQLRWPVGPVTRKLQRLALDLMDVA
jgi:4-amino-4-deoxychorismate lyase